MKTEQAYGMDKRLAAKVSESASLANGTFLNVLKSNQCLKSGAKRTIPNEEDAESTNEVETDACGDAMTIAIMATPSEFMLYGRRFAK